MGRTVALVFALAVLSACGRTDLDGGLLSDTTPGDGAPSEPGHTKPDPPDKAPPDPPDQPPPDEPASEALPEICLSARVDFQGKALSFVLFAPFESNPGPFRVSDSEPLGSAFSPGGARFAFVDERGLSVVDAWPPEPLRVDTDAPPLEFAFLDDARIVVNTGSTLELHDLGARTRETLTVAAETSAALPPLYLTRPSPDGRFIAYGQFSTGFHEVWLLDLEAAERLPAMVMTLPAGAVLAWFDWAPDSAHLAISATDTEGVWLRAYAAATKQAPFEAHPISFELEGNAGIPTFSWSPAGDALHYLYQDVLESGESDWRLYFVKMSGDVPGPSVRLNTFGERNWASEGYWSPGGDMIAFKAEFAGNTFRAAEFVTRVHGDLQLPQKQHLGEFASVLKQEWAPDNQALYFTAQGENEREQVYKSDLSGTSTLVSSPAATVRGLYVSPDPGCIAYSQSKPEAALVIADESTQTKVLLEAPESTDSSWTGNFDASQATWVTDRTGDVQGLLYVASRLYDGGDALAWVEVHDCVPSETETLIAGTSLQSIYDLRVSTTAPSGERQ